MGNSLTYRILRRAGLNFSEEEYGNVTIWFLLKRLLKRYKNAILLKISMFSIILTPIAPRLLRPKLWKMMGCKVGIDVYIGYEVLVDSSYAELIELEDRVHIANRCILLCHQRNLSNYYKGDDYSKLPYKKKNIKIKKGALIGMSSIILPGVTIGEGAIIGAGSLVTKDIPEWTIATGRPARVVKVIKERGIL